MNIKLKFDEGQRTIPLRFSDDGYNKGYEDGEAEGKAVGEIIGYNNAVASLTELSVTENGTYTPSEGIGFNSVNVDVQPSLQTKTVTPTKSQQTVTPDSTYDGLSTVTVNAIPEGYVVPSGTKNITTNGTHSVSGYANASVTVPTGITPSGTISITENKTYDVTNYANASVNVQPSLQSKTVTPTKSAQETMPDSGYDGLSKVNVEAIPAQYIIPSGTKAITDNANGIDVTEYASVNVDVQPSLQTKTVTPTKSQQTVTPDSTYDGLSTVTVNAIPEGYVVPSGTRTITENGSYNIRSYEAVSVNVEPDLETLNVVKNGTYTGAYDTVNVNVPETTLTTLDITENGTYNAPANTGFNVVNVSVEGSGEVDFTNYETYGTNLGSVYYLNITGSMIKNLTEYTTDASYDYDNLPSVDTLITAAENTVLTTSGSTGDQDLTDRTFAWLYIKKDGYVYGCEVESGGGGGGETESPSGDWAIGTDWNGKSLSLNYGAESASFYNTFYPQISDESATLRLTFVSGYSLLIDSDSYGAKNIKYYDPVGNVMYTLLSRDGTTVDTSIVSFNASYIISGYSYSGIYNDGSGYSSEDFWNRITQILNEIFVIS